MAIMTSSPVVPPLSGSPVVRPRDEIEAQRIVRDNNGRVVSAVVDGRELVCPETHRPESSARWWDTIVRDAVAWPEWDEFYADDTRGPSDSVMIEFLRSLHDDRASLLAERDALTADVTVKRELNDQYAEEIIALEAALSAERARADALAATVERVRALHQPGEAIIVWRCDTNGAVTTDPGRACTGCSEATGTDRHVAEWPCPTVAALADPPATPEPREATRQQIVTRLRDWLHETPMSRCSASSDICDTWPLAYELADRVLGPAAPPATDEPDGAR